jgi:DNA-binding NtrC family response regulator
VRELRNAVARQLTLGELASHQQRGDAARADVDDGPASVPPDPGDSMGRLLAQGLPFIEARERLLEDFEQRYVRRVLAEHGGDVARAAAASGIGRRYFQKIRARNR